MLKLDTYKDKVVGVYGLGASGLSVIAALQASGAHVFFFDDSKVMRARAAKSGLVPTHPKDWPWNEMVVLVPGMDEAVGFPASHPIMRKCAQSAIPVHSDVDLFVREIAPEDMPIIVGVTGVNGKTTTTELISHIIHEAGDLVHTVTGRGKQILSIDKTTQDSFVVMEMAPTKLRFTASLCCDVGILLNANHVDGKIIEDDASLMKACSRIFRNQNNDHVAIIGVDDNLAQKMCTAMMLRASRMPEQTGRVIPISSEATLGEGIFVLNGSAFSAEHGKTSVIADFARAPAILGAHLFQDTAAAVAACLELGISAAQITRALLNFKGVTGRMQCLGDRDNVVCVDDSKARNIAATVKSLTSDEEIFWVGGGVDVDSDYNLLAENLLNVRKAFLFGDAAGPLAAAIGDACDVDLYVTQAEAINAAMIEARQFAAHNEITAKLLYSPGCPLREKGGATLFRQLVQRFLEGKEAA